MKRLEHDLRYDLIRGSPWQPEEFAYESETHQVLGEGILADQGTYWFRSPHSTVYRVQRDGALSVA